jgi:hypothetical protein
MLFRLIAPMPLLLAVGGLVSAQNVQLRAEALIAKARQLSDIRAKSAAPFRLTATFWFVGKGLDVVQGSYIETWVSDSQWRRETILGELRHVEIGGPNKRWVSYSDGFPKGATRLPYMMNVAPPLRADGWTFTSITENAKHDAQAECAFTKPTPDKGIAFSDKRIAFCFEKSSGVLLEKIVPEMRVRVMSDFACEYGGFRNFGGYLFPYEMNCFEDGHKTISAKVSELSLQPAPDTSLFAPAADAIELPECSGKVIPPYRTGKDFGFSGLQRNRLAWVPVWLVVDAKTKLQSVRVLSTEPKSSYESSLKTLESWSFHSGTCDGKPIAMPLTVEIPYTPH